MVGIKGNGPVYDCDQTAAGAIMKSPHHQIAFSIVTRNPNVLLDDEPLDGLIEDIASALQDAFDLGFKAAGGSIYPLVEGLVVLRHE
jgi:hypothetical protein